MEGREEGQGWEGRRGKVGRDRESYMGALEGII